MLIIRERKFKIKVVTERETKSKNKTFLEKSIRLQNIFDRSVLEEKKIEVKNLKYLNKG